MTDAVRKTTDSVRQVLMNELGLTRESIREQVTSIVREEVGKKMNSLVQEDFIGKTVRESFDRLVRANQWNGPSVRSLISEAAGKAFAEHVKTLL